MTSGVRVQSPCVCSSATDRHLPAPLIDTTLFISWPEWNVSTNIFFEEILGWLRYCM